MTRPRWPFIVASADGKAPQAQLKPIGEFWTLADPPNQGSRHEQTEIEVWGGT